MEFLQVYGNRILTETGKPVTLRGTCIGGWLNMEDFINGYPGTESQLRRRMAETIGAGRADMFFSSLLDNFLRPEDIAFLSSLGVNCVRIALNYRHFEDDEQPFVYREEGFRRLDTILDACAQYGVYAVLDMHSVPGWQNCHWHSDNERGVSLFWGHRQFQDRLVGLWQAFAQRYRDRAEVAGYELMNEPATGTPSGDHPFDFYENYQPDWTRMNRIYARLIGEIRQIDTRHIIFLEGDDYGRRFEGLSPELDGQVVYSAHHYVNPGYGPGAYPGEFASDNGPVYWDRAQQRESFRHHSGSHFADCYGVPLWMSEFGSQYHGPKEQLPYRYASISDQLGVYNEGGVSWTTWTYKDAGVMGWVMFDPDCDYMRLVRPVQEMKRRLGAENFVANYFDDCVGKQYSRRLADCILDISGQGDIYRADANFYTLNYTALTGYAAAMLQPVFARQFVGMNEDRLEELTQAFRLENCVRNEPYLEILKQRLQGKVE